MSEKEFQKISLNFRKVASRFLKSDFQAFNENLKRFLLFVEESSIINEFIQENNIKDFDIKKTLDERGYNSRFQLPIRESEEIAFIYQLLNFISKNNLDISSISYGYGNSKKIQNHVSSFSDTVIKQLVDHIVTYLGEMKIDMGFDKKSGTHFTFNNEFKGQFNHAQDHGQISAQQNYTEIKVRELKEVAENFVEELKKNEAIGEVKKNETIEFLEASIQEIESEKPKKAIMKTALDKVKEVNEFATAGSALFKVGTQLVELFQRVLV